jgi:wyosine [tRNA(Phe)-imidazoG37] synthetase (radical SAM superfamily)
MMMTFEADLAAVQQVPAQASSIYGPVHSWRMGWSLGVDLLLNSSICSFNCIYCQLGDIQVKTRERAIYVPTAKVERDLRLSDWEKADVITFSGNGEPTLALNLGEVLHMVKEYTSKPTLVLTNATLLNDPAVRAALQEADHVACKLDAASDTVLQRMNRPVAGISHASILEGIATLRAQYTGKLSLQCMFMPSNEEEVEALVATLAPLGAQEVQLNTPKRPYPLSWLAANRGNHSEALVESRTLRTISQPQAQHIETLMRQRLGPSVNVLSVYATT